ncbi:MAG: AAA family ATPase [Candidatus Bathyarchaeota archaeon]|jgi:dephospho-CoA kinase|nr:AAA family ATPase [Candidatus Bathyarchaeota archaeon]
MVDKKLVIGLAGMPGSGKSIVVNVAKENGYSVVVMGDVVREETAKRGLELTPHNVGKVMLDLREKEGAEVIAKRCIPKIDASTRGKVIIDGLRSLHEVDEFKKYFPSFRLLAIHSSPETRFRRLYNRRRSDDPDGWTVFHERDMRELCVGLGNVIAMAESIVVNEEAYDIVKERARNVLLEVEKKWKT